MTKQMDRKPMVRFKGFNKIWDKKKLGTICREFQSGSFIRASEITESGEYPVYGGNGLRGYTTSYNHDGLYALIGRQGALCGNMNLSLGKAFFTEHAIAVQADDQNNTLFLYYLLGIMNLGQYSGQSAQPGLAVKKLLELPAFVGDKNEQAEIAKYFKKLDSLIQLHTLKHDKLVTLKLAMMQKMFPQGGASVPEIRFKGFQGDWNQKKLGEIATFSKGTGYSKSDLIASGVPIVLYGRLYTNYETEITKVDTFVLEKSGAIKSKGREVVVPASGETSADIARASAIMTEGIILGGDLNIIIPSDVLESSFLALTLSSGKPQQDLARRAQGKSVVHVRKADIEEIVINYPKTDEQTKIILYFRNINRLIANHSAQLEKMKQLKSACLAKMFV